ncbi:MAG: hypothetical protein ACLFP8_01315 [Alphaproteobacteria bacterium]
MSTHNQNQTNQPYQPQAHALPSNPNHAIGDVIAAARVLEDIYTAEINALRKPDTNAFLELQSSKIEAAQTYYAMMTQMIERKNELGQADATMRQKLREMHEHFTNTTKQNLEVVMRMKNCSQRLGNTLRNAALKAARRESTLSYGKDGSVPEGAARHIVSSGLSETV